MNTPNAQPAPEQRFYSTLENWIELASPDSPSLVYSAIEEGLNVLKGPKAAGAKKALEGIAVSKSVLTQLIAVRESMGTKK